MRFNDAIDRYVEDMRADGRINSPHTEQSYRFALEHLADTVGNRDPGKVGKADVKRALARWPRPRTRAQRHACYLSFFDWTVYEGIRDTNPARMVRKPRVKPAPVRRLTRGEIVRLLDAADANRRDRWAVNLMLYAGLRNAELRGLKGFDLLRPGWVHIVGKGGKERWAPVVPELVPVVDEILSMVAPERFVLPGRRTSDPGVNTLQHDSEGMLSSAALQKQVKRIGVRAGLAVDVSPHTLRHCYGDAVARYAGVRAAQSLLGHSSIETTVGTYTGAMSLDEIAASLSGFGYRGVGVVSAIPADREGNTA